MKSLFCIVILLFSFNSSANDSSSFKGGATPVIGIAKSAVDSGSQVTFTLNIENFGNTLLENISVTDNLDDVFGAGNYSIINLPMATGTLSSNPGYDGSSDTNILTSATSTLAVGTVATVTFTVDVTNVTNMGAGFGIYSNQASIQASEPGGMITTDLSDDGNDPDPDGDNNPNEFGENDSTPIDLSSVPVELLNFEID